MCERVVGAAVIYPVIYDEIAPLYCRPSLSVLTAYPDIRTHIGEN